MAQPPLSQSIRNLEAEVGAKLLHRTTRRTWLTRGGATFYAEAVRILESVERLKAAIRSDSVDFSEKLIVGLAEAAAGEPFTRFLFELEHWQPPITFDVREVTPSEVTQSVLDGVLDVAISLAPVKASGLRTVRAWAERLSLLAPFGHPLAERDQIALADLSSETFIMPNAVLSPGYAGQLQGLFERHGLRPTKTVVVKHQNTMISFVAMGRGLAVLPETVVHGLTTVVVVPLAEDDAEGVSWLVYRDEEPSEVVSVALELASLIDVGNAPPSDAGRGK